MLGPGTWQLRLEADLFLKKKDCVLKALVYIEIVDLLGLGTHLKGDKT